MTRAAMDRREALAMELVGARFSDAGAAETAMGEIRESVTVGTDDMATHALGSTRYESPSADVVLAGRFDPADAEAVLRILRRHGGTIVLLRNEPRDAGEARLQTPVAPHRDVRVAAGWPANRSPARATADREEQKRPPARSTHRRPLHSPGTHQVGPGRHRRVSR